MKIKLLKTIKNSSGLPRLEKVNCYDYRNLSCNHPDDVHEMMTDLFALHKQTEEFLYEICLNTRGNILGIFEISHGTADCTCISAREIFQKAVLCGATAFILVHNHPSGNLKPSKDDQKAMIQLKQASKIMNILFMDSIIIGNGFYSFMENSSEFSA